MESNVESNYSPRPSSRRLQALIVGIGAIVILSVAAWLSPSADGVGTHKQLGLPQCGWIVAVDLPCPTCGMTTAFSYTVRGNFISALKTQPFGMFLAVFVAITGILALIIVLTGRPKVAFWYRWMTTKTLFIVAGLAAFAWVYKILVHRGWFL
ncbi:MAG: DUF2752 domain-containing protein [Planctomycetes bacterium]|nr:DUF2752 domain-containing protein [Planctomycetota bacterium]